jgi:hypothetical protein
VRVVRVRGVRVVRVVGVRVRRRREGPARRVRGAEPAVVLQPRVHAAHLRTTRSHALATHTPRLRRASRLNTTHALLTLPSISKRFLFLFFK